MADKTGTITRDGKPVAQLQIMTSSDGGRRVQLYNAGGVFLCETPFTGEDERGFEMGQSLYAGYIAAWENARAFYTKKVIDAMGKSAMTGIE